MNLLCRVWKLFETAFLALFVFWLLIAPILLHVRIWLDGFLRGLGL